MIEISKAAIAEITRMQTVRQQTDHKFRIGMSRGGCKGFYYTIDLEDTASSEDSVYQIDGISVAIDCQQIQYLDRLKLDYAEDLMGGGFRFENPRAIAVCGCGNSFSLGD